MSILRSSAFAGCALAGLFAAVSCGGSGGTGDDLYGPAAGAGGESGGSGGGTSGAGGGAGTPDGAAGTGGGPGGGDSGVAGASGVGGGGAGGGPGGAGGAGGGPGGAAGAGAAAGMGGMAGQGGGPPLPSVWCGTKSGPGVPTCSPPQQFCCLWFNNSKGPGQCKSMPQECNYGTRVYCDEPSDCPPTQICCGQMVGGNEYSEITCRAICDRNQNQVTFCNPANPVCPAEQPNCKQSQILPTGYFVCGN